jgi:serine/threonine-protein kinase
VALLGLVALAGIAVGALAAAGAFNQSAVTTTRAGVTTPATSTKQSSTSTTSTSGPSGVALKQCSGDVLVRQDTTSCAFGQNVEKAYLQTSGGTTDVVAYSPVTRATYTMHCTGGSPHVCTGGSNSEVQFTSNPSSSSVSLPAPPSGSLKRCDQNIQADRSTTSCGFAKNVFVAYWNNYKANGAQANATVTASSPATGQTYPMSCPSDGTTVVCTGGNSAYVTFPLQAVRAYTGP